MALSMSLANRKKPTGLAKKLAKYKIFYLFMLPGITIFILFNYLPMAGIAMSFFDLNIRLESRGFIGLKNYISLFQDSAFGEAFRNTFVLSSLNIILSMLVVLVLSLLMNEIRRTSFKRLVQTAIYLPHFLSWVTVASIFTLLLSPNSGMIGSLIWKLSGEPVVRAPILENSTWWTPIFLFIMVWKETGWGTVVFLAALAGIDPQLYEAAEIDGAGRLRQTFMITLPHLANVIVIVLLMQMSKIFNIFQSVFNLQNPSVYGVSEVIETYVYHRGMIGKDYDYGAAVGFFKAVIALFLVLVINKIAKKIQGESVL